VPVRPGRSKPLGLRPAVQLTDRNEVEILEVLYLQPLCSLLKLAFYLTQTKELQERLAKATRELHSKDQKLQEARALLQETDRELSNEKSRNKALEDEMKVLEVRNKVLEANSKCSKATSSVCET
jgi:septal ring factor EnvC (AmiA/AmiB activator)